MSSLIQDRGRGPEIAGTMITVYNLLHSFLDPTVTEQEICRIYDLTPRQVAEARADVLSNPETMLAEHLKIEDRLAVGNAPAVREQARRAREMVQRFQRWLEARATAAAQDQEDQERSRRFPTFREWLVDRQGQ